MSAGSSPVPFTTNSAEKIVSEFAVLDPAEAKRLDSRIRWAAQSVADGATKLAGLITEAKQGEIHRVLGFASWTAYLADALSQLKLALNAVDRRELVAVMADEGMSSRAIAKAIGVSHVTVTKDQKAAVADQVLSDLTPELTADDRSRTPDHLAMEPTVKAPPTSVDVVVTGMDGKTYTRPGSKPPRCRPTTDAFSKQISKVAQIAADLERLSGEDSFGRDADTLNFRRSDLVGARDALIAVIANLDRALA